MSKPLRLILQNAKLDGVKSSKTTPLTTGEDPDITYAQRSKAGRDFVKKNGPVEKHADRVGNGDEVYKGTTKPAKFMKQDPNTYGIKEAKGMKCETCSKEECECGSVKNRKLLLGGKKGLAEILAVKEEVEALDESDPLKARERLTRHIHKKDEFGNSPYNKKAVAHNHLKGMIKSVKGKHTKPNLPEEVETIDELSRETLASYTRKAASQATKIPLLSKDAEDRGDEAGAKRLNRKFRNRMHGIRTATQKLAKEELAFPMLEGGKNKKAKSRKEEKESAPSDGQINLTYGDGVAQGRI